MIIKGIIAEDFINYKLPSMIIEFPYCSFKCDKECGYSVCQNSNLAKSPNYNISTDKIITFYLNNIITRAIIFQGLEPFDSYKDMLSLLKKFRQVTNDPIIIYTGYTEEELELKILELQKLFNNIIIKFGRYIPNHLYKYDDILGVTLASNNQYAKQIC